MQSLQRRIKRCWRGHHYFKFFKNIFVAVENFLRAWITSLSERLYRMYIDLAHFDWTKTENWRMAINGDGEWKIQVRAQGHLHFVDLDYSDCFSSHRRSDQEEEDSQGG